MANADGSTSPLVLPAPAGTSVVDTATFFDLALDDSTPPKPFYPTGTVTYTFTGSELIGLTAPPSWTVTIPVPGTAVWTETVTIGSLGAIPNSDATGPLPAGMDYSFLAIYTPAPTETEYTSSKGDAEPLTIGQGTTSTATTILDSVTNLPPTGYLGEKVYDTATVTGTPFTPTGTVTYEFFTTINGTGTHVDQTVTLNANGTVPNSTISAALMAGSYSYIAIYSGDSNYKGSTGVVEPLTIGQGRPAPRRQSWTRSPTCRPLGIWERRFMTRRR